MATMKIKGAEELYRALEMMSGIEADELAKRGLHEGMKPVADAVRSNLSSVIQNGNGDLLNSLGVSPIRRNDKGGWDVKVGFAGYDGRPQKGFPKGVPNTLKARALESGTSRGQPKRPFLRKAVNAVKSAALNNMQQEIEAGLEKAFKEFKK